MSSRIAYKLYGVYRATVSIQNSIGMQQTLQRINQKSPISAFVFDRFICQTGDEYTLEIKIDSYSLKTQCIVPPKPRVTAIKVSKAENANSSELRFTLLPPKPGSTSNKGYYILNSFQDYYLHSFNSRVREEFTLIGPAQQNVVLNNHINTLLSIASINKKGYELLKSANRQYKSKRNPYITPVNIESTFESGHFTGGFIGLNKYDTFLYNNYTDNSPVLYVVNFKDTSGNTVKTNDIQKVTLSLFEVSGTGRLIKRDARTQSSGTTFQLSKHYLQKEYHTTIPDYNNYYVYYISGYIINNNNLKLSSDTVNIDLTKTQKQFISLKLRQK